jgi:iron(III) transport system substrate-binding protein
MTIGTLIRRAALAGVAAVALASTPAFAQKTKLTVYTALENDQLDPFKKAFEADNPAIEIAWVRDSTGVVAAKLMAEKDNPRADIIWGLAASNVGLMASLGMLDPYTPPAAAALKPAFRSGKSPDTWIGMDAYLSLVCFNTAEAAKGKKPKPATCCAPSPASIRRPRAPSARRGATSRPCRPPGATSASSSSPMRCFPTSP